MCGTSRGKTKSSQALGPWLSRNKADLERGSWRHAWRGLVRKEKYFKDHPQYFSLKRGRRTAKQLCTTNPEVIRIAAGTLVAQMSSSSDLVFPAGPNDGGNLCECEECAKLHTPGYLEPSSGKPSHTSIVFKFASDIAEITSKRLPDRDLGILIYSEYSRVPAKIKKVNRNVFPMFAPIRRCRLHGPGNPLCSWNRLWQEEIRGWAKLTDKLGFYNYNYNLADTLVPFTKFDFYKRLVKQVRDLDIKELAWVSETIDSWAMHAPHMWLSARLSWDSRIDVDEELDRFFTGFYGASSRPMRRYWLRIDDAYATTDTHTGSQYGLHHVWTEGLLAQSRRNIEEAKRLASNKREREAVAMAEAGLRCAELFTKIWNEIGSFDFLEAARTEKELENHVSRMASRTEPPSWAHERYAWGYYSRFVGRTVEGGAKILRGGGRILARLPDVWKFRRDPGLVGVENRWYVPRHEDSRWDEIATFSKSWDDQGLGGYHGEAWYRTRFTVPASARGLGARLWFGGFDHNVDVYLNGKHLGERKGFATPREFEGIAEHLSFGGENVLAVRVASGGLAEFGTGGIMMPVMIYAPGGGPSGKEGGGGVEYEM